MTTDNLFLGSNLIVSKYRKPLLQRFRLISIEKRAIILICVQYKRK
ncbi:hypothetical protein T03_15763 [Trichinella britovi]|uniref:Uncharacterized protein n=1 Tax=Trichinella britovi TaxID=45882 RepID=A0A0V0YU79_TRIBR|nr:hypothetical protein T03_15763 [Trichinella britovi]